MAYKTMYAHCKEWEMNGISTRVDFLDMLYRLYGMEFTVGTVEWTAEWAREESREAVRQTCWNNLEQLCRKLVELGFLEPILRFALMLKRWDERNDAETLGIFLDKIGAVELLGQSLAQVCVEGVNAYVTLRGEQTEGDPRLQVEDDNYGVEAALLGKFVAEKLLGVACYDREKVLATLGEKGVNTRDPLVRAGWLSCFCDSLSAVQRAQILCEDFLPAMTERCGKGWVEAREREICVSMARIYLEYCVMLGETWLTDPLHREERRCIPEGAPETVWEGANIFLRDVLQPGHLTYLQPVYPGLGRACKDFLGCADTDLFRQMQHLHRDAIHALVPVMVYALYTEKLVHETGKVILEYFPGMLQSVCAAPVLQRISVKCCMQTRDLLQMQQLYGYINGLYAQTSCHENISRRFPAEVMHLLRKHRDDSLLAQAKACMDESEELRKTGAEMGLSEEAILEKIRNSEQYLRLCQNAMAGIPSVADMEAEALKGRDNFFVVTGLQGNQDLLSRLPANEAKAVMDCLVLGEAIFRHCQKLEANNFVMDYSPALVEMTKALEIVNNYLFRRMNPVYHARLTGKQITSYFKETPKGSGVYRKKSHIEMGNFAYLLDSEDRNGDSLFNQWRLGQVLDTGKLQQLGNLTIKTRSSNSRFGANEADNRRMLMNAMLYVGTQFRNKAAHTGIVSRVEYEEARGLLLSAQCLLWILLYITK